MHAARRSLRVASASSSAFFFVVPYSAARVPCAVSCVPLLFIYFSSSCVRLCLRQFGSVWRW